MWELRISTAAAASGRYTHRAITWAKVIITLTLASATIASAAAAALLRRLCTLHTGSRAVCGSHVTA